MDTLTAAPRLPFDNSYARLPERFFAPFQPSAVSAPLLIELNEPLAQELGLDIEWLKSPDGLAMLAGNQFPEGAEPIAMAYAGHQFGQFSPQLGDGRATLLGEVVDAQGRRRDLQLKGSGPTSFSRRGDGRAAIGPVLREYIVSEAMAALGIPTTRALAAVSTGDPVYRETVMPGAVLTRVASSHIRVGTFQFFAARSDEEAVKLLADHAINRHYPDAKGAENPYRALLEAVIEAQASLVARWMGVGFIHGVMNTDNMAISGETIDYGPCAFLDAYDPAKVFSSIDQGGRYAYANQPGIAQWNLARLAEALLPLLHEDRDEGVKIAQSLIAGFREPFEKAYMAVLRAKFGLLTQENEDGDLMQGLLDRMMEGGADFTRTFRALTAAAGDPAADRGVRAEFIDPMLYETWVTEWRARLAREPEQDGVRVDVMRRANPALIPRNHRIEEAIKAAIEHADFTPFRRLNSVLSRPFDDQPEQSDLAIAPEPDQRVLRTFCGT
ncbi:YdiU family protein [Tianweitania sp. BSSL-BM11]|uniref:Protein nucleotidyltransferase YdiU n=1 Tax=Tianweitania aestuarii TaxID=2814886 RepID=A0ABS5RXG9_9HYPH|nr:YdiU family protein [Tianweitania aestuarii]MBS9721714.1 YdiU family protein [Tianweitania aestuarii]